MKNPRNRVIYQSESVFVSKSLDSRFDFDHNELRRLQGANYGFTMNRTDVNQYGKLGRIDSINLELPTVNFDMSYLLGDGYNEEVLGFNTDENYQFAKSHLEVSSGRNFYVVTSEEGVDSTSLDIGDNYSMIGIGNAFLTDYSVDLSVGSLPIVNLQYQCSNINSINGFVEGEGFWVSSLSGSIASIDLDKGKAHEGPVILSRPSNTGQGGPTALRPGDITLNFEGFNSENQDSETISILSGNGSFHLQSANLSIPLSRSELKRFGSKGAYARVLDYPIKATLTVNSILSNLESVDLAESIRVCSDSSTDNNVSILAKDCEGSPAIIWNLKKPQVISETFSSNIGPNKSVDIVFEVEIGDSEDTSIGITCSGASDFKVLDRDDDNPLYPTRVFGYESEDPAGASGIFVGSDDILLDFELGDVEDNWKYNTQVGSYGIHDNIRRVAPGGSTSYIGNGAFYNLDIIGEVYITKSITGVGDSAFESTDINSLVIGDGLKEVGERSFFGCPNLKTVESSGPVEIIKLNSFRQCGSLESFNCVGIQSIGGYAFYNCYDLSQFDWGESLIDIEQRAFYGCSSLTSANFYEGLESIGTWAFYANNSLAQVNIPGSVSSFGDYAFYNARIQNLIVNSGVSGFSKACFNSNISLTNIQLPDTLEVINDYCFRYCVALNTVDIPDSVHTIGVSAFEGQYNNNNSVDVVNFGSGLKTIGNSAFKYCRSLDSAVLPEGLEQIGTSAFENCFVLSGRVDIPDSVISIGNNAYQNCYEISGVDIGAGITNVSDSCFQNCIALTGVDIPNTVLTMEQEAFMGCTNLSGININTTLSVIPTRCFQSCNSLTGVDIPSNIISIGTSSFSSCFELTGINFAEGIEAIGDSAFLSCSDLTGISFPDSLTSIGASSFSNCSTLSGELTYNQNLESVGDSAFQNTDIVKINFNTNPAFTIIEDSCFSNCGELSGIDLTANITNVNSNAFLNCYQLSGINFNETITDIGNSAFQNCTSLTEVTYPESLINVGTSAFKGCTSMETINFNTNAAFTNIAANCFENNTSLITLTITDNIVNLDGSAFKGCNQIATIDFGDFTEYIGNNAFESCSNLNNLIIPITVTGIDDSAFSFCTSLDTMSVFPEVLIDIGDSAFYGCPLSGINNVITIPDSVTDIGDSAFYNNKFSGFYLGANINYLSPRTFESCLNLSGINLSLINNIGDYCFRNCTNFSEYLIPDGITNIGRDAFKNTKVPDCTIPNSLTKINSYTFADCSELTGIINGQSLTWIDTYAFANCTSLKEYYAPASLDKIGSYAFNGCTSLSGLDLNQVDTIDPGALRGISIDYVNVPDTVISLGANVFENCPLLSGFSIGLGIDSIPAFTFKNCTSISGLLNIQNHIKQIQQEAFRGLNQLTGVSFPEGLEFIGGGFTNWNQPFANGSFSECSNISGDIVLPSTLTGLGRYAFYQCDLVDTFRFNSPSAPKTRIDALPSKFINDPNNNPIHAPVGSELNYSGESYAPSFNQYGDKAPINWSNLNIVFDL